MAEDRQNNYKLQTEIKKDKKEKKQFVFSICRVLRACYGI